MNQRKYIALLSISCLAVSCLTGCGDKDKLSDQPVETTVVSETTAAVSTTNFSESTEATTVTENPVYPTDVPEIQNNTTVPASTTPAVNYSWDTIQQNTINGTYDTFTPVVNTPVNCEHVSENAFASNLMVESASFCNPYTEIGAYAFSGCTNLKDLELPGYTETISPYAFQDCTALTKLELPETVTEIGESAFYGCTNLMNVQLNESLKKIDKTAFYGCSSLVNIVLPDSVIEIGDYAFGNCQNLLNITIPASVRKCGLYPVSGSADLSVEKQNTIQVFVQKNSWMDVNFDMVFSGTSCVKVYY